MKKVLCQVLLIFLIIPALLAGGITVFADTSAADFYGIITISNNSSTPAVDVSTNISGLNTASMITAGYLNSTANNCAIQNTSSADIAFMPGYGSSSWVIWAGNMTSNQISSAILYCKNVTGGKIAYFPNGAGMTVTTNTSLDIGSSGNFTWNGWFDPASTGYLLNKSGAITVQGNGSGNITVTGTSGAINSGRFVPNGADSATDLTPSAGTNWACVSDNSDLTWVSKYGTAPLSDLYAITDTTQTGTINSVTVYFRIKTNGTTYFKPRWKMGATTYNGTEQNTNAAAFTEFNQAFATSPATGIAWTWTELNNAECGIWLWGGASGVYSYCADIWYIISYNPTATVKSSVISAGEHTIMVYLAANLLGIKVDSNIVNTTAFTGNITVSGAPLAFCTNNITPYVNSIEVWKAGVRTGYWYWEYGATFLDHSGSGNTGTPSFRTAASDPDVTANLTLFAPTSQPIAPAFAIGTGPAFISGIITSGGNFTSGNTSLTYPGEDIIRSISNATGTPYQLPSTFIATFLILATSMLTSLFLKSNATASMFVKTVVNTIGYGTAVALQIYDWWMLIFFFIFEIAFWFAAAERH